MDAAPCEGRCAARRRAESSATAARTPWCPLRTACLALSLFVGVSVDLGGAAPPPRSLRSQSWEAVLHYALRAQEGTVMRVGPLMRLRGAGNQTRIEENQQAALLEQQALLHGGPTSAPASKPQAGGKRPRDEEGKDGGEATSKKACNDTSRTAAAAPAPELHALAQFNSTAAPGVEQVAVAETPPAATDLLVKELQEENARLQRLLAKTASLLASTASAQAPLNTTEVTPAPFTLRPSPCTLHPEP